MACETLLIIEDNAANLKLLLAILRPHGYRLLTAQDGEEAVRLAIQEHPALILMDLRLPRLGGAAATRRIRQDPACAGVLVVALTAQAVEEDADTQSAGFDGYITKPINTRIFPDQVRQFLDKAGRENEAPFLT